MRIKKTRFKIIKDSDSNGFFVKVKMGWMWLWQWKFIDEREHPNGTKPLHRFNSFDEVMEFMEH